MLNKKLSIIIVNYKSADFLEECVCSIYGKISEKISFEVIVVNNDEEKVKIFQKYPQIKIINTNGNFGFGAGINIGARVAQGDILFFLNPDTQLSSSNMSSLLALFDQEEALGVIGCQLRDESGEAEKWSAGSEISLTSLILNNIGWLSSEKTWQQKEIVPVDWVSAAALFVKKDIFEEIGGFDENFFMYFEDMDLCTRVSQKGKKVLYCPYFPVKHLGGKSYAEQKKQKKDYYKSQQYYFKKNKSFFQWGVVRIMGKLFYNV
jgi:hypothetical protein